VLAAQLKHCQPALGLTQHGHDLGFGETALLHRNLLVHPDEKILPAHPLNHGEDYPASTDTDWPLRVNFVMVGVLAGELRGQPSRWPVARIAATLAGTFAQGASGFAMLRSQTTRRHRRSVAPGRGATG
jgi:hypothetical protein